MIPRCGALPRSLSWKAATICLSIASMGPFSNERTSMSTEQEGAMVFTEVPPLIVPIVKVVTGASGTLMCAIFAPAMQTAWIADGTLPEGGVAVAAGALHRHAPAVRRSRFGGCG